MQHSKFEKRIVGRTKAGAILYSNGEIHTEEFIYPDWNSFLKSHSVTLDNRKHNELLPLSSN